MMIFVPAGGADIPTATPGVLLGLSVPTTVSSGTTVTTTNPGNQNLLEIVTAGLAVVVVALSLVILTRIS